MSSFASTFLTILAIINFTSSHGQYQLPMVPMPYQQTPWNVYQPQTQPYYYPQQINPNPVNPYLSQSQYYSQQPQINQMMYTNLATSNRRMVLPQGYRIEPLNQGANQRLTLPYGYRIEPLDVNDITAEIPQVQPETQEVNQLQPQPMDSDQPIDVQQPREMVQQPRIYYPTLQNRPDSQSNYTYYQPKVTVEVVTSAPPEFIVKKNTYTTKYSNTNNTGFHLVEHKPFNSTIRRVFTTDGSESANKVYTINIVNGVEVTTTEDPNAIGYGSAHGHSGNVGRTGGDSEELEEDANNEEEEEEEDATLKPVNSWSLFG